MLKVFHFSQESFTFSNFCKVLSAENLLLLKSLEKALKILKDFDNIIQVLNVRPIRCDSMLWNYSIEYILIDFYIFIMLFVVVAFVQKAEREIERGKGRKRTFNVIDASL